MTVLIIKLICLSLLILFDNSHAAHLPSYITPCSLSDPKFSDCAAESANRAIPSIVKGDKKYKIRNMNPLVLPEVKVGHAADHRILLNNVTTDDLSRLKLKSVKVDTSAMIFSTVSEMDRLEVICDYDIVGRLFSLPIKGKGKANLTTVHATILYDLKYNLKTVNGEEYMNIIDKKLKFDAKRAYYDLQNIFGNNKELSDEFNRNINENWDVLAKDLFPVLADIMASIAESVYRAIFSVVPYKEIFSP